MTSLAAPEAEPRRAGRPQHGLAWTGRDARANRALKWLALGGGALVFLVLMAIVYQILSGASGAFDKFGFAFIVHKPWVPAASEFGAWTFIYGTLVTGFVASCWRRSSASRLACS